MPLSTCSTLSGTGFASWPGGAWTPAGSIAATAQAGAVRVVGRRLPSLSERLASRRTRWHRLRVTGWYGQTERQVEIVSGTTVWSHPGRHLPIRYVLVRDGTDEVRPPAVLCTDIKADPLDIRRWFVRRWCTEVTFAEVRRHLGVETQSQWSDQTIARTTPALLGLCSLVTLWADQHCTTDLISPWRASWSSKPLPTVADALASRRRELCKARFPAPPQTHQIPSKCRVPC